MKNEKEIEMILHDERVIFKIIVSKSCTVKKPIKKNVISQQQIVPLNLYRKEVFGTLFRL